MKELAQLSRAVRRKTREAVWRKAWQLELEIGPLAAAKHPKAANYRARMRYVPSASPGRVDLFRCTETAASEEADPHNGWSDLVEGGIEVHRVPGTHTSMYREPHVWSVVEKLRACLRRDRAARAEQDDGAEPSRLAS